MAVLDDIPLMENEVDEDIIRYIQHNYLHLMTMTENAAYKHLNLLFTWQDQDETSSLIKMARKKGWLSDNPAVLEFTKEGRDAFLRRTAVRIYQDNKDAIFINRCPQCNRPARTTLARQCPHCFHTWQNE